MNELYCKLPKEIQNEFDSPILSIIAAIYACVLLYVFIPLFLISRLFSMLFPLISIINILYLDPDGDYKSIALLQWILTIAYGVLVASWVIAVIRCLDYYHWTSHLMPGGDTWKCVPQNQYQRLNLMQKYYDQRLSQKYLGKNIGGLIVSYWSSFEMNQWLQQFGQQLKNLDNRCLDSKIDYF